MGQTDEWNFLIEILSFYVCLGLGHVAKNYDNLQIPSKHY